MARVKQRRNGISHHDPTKNKCSAITLYRGKQLADQTPTGRKMAGERKIRKTVLGRFDSDFWEVGGKGSSLVQGTAEFAGKPACFAASFGESTDVGRERETYVERGGGGGATKRRAGR